MIPFLTLSHQSPLVLRDLGPTTTPIRPRVCPSQGLTGPHVPLAKSTPQSARGWWTKPGQSLVLLPHVKKQPGATEEVQISSLHPNGLDPDGCAHDNRTPCLWFLSAGNTEATTMTLHNYACSQRTIDMLKSNRQLL